MKKMTLNLLIFLIASAAGPLAAQDPLAIAIELIAVQKGNGIDLKATVTDEENSEPVKGLTLTFSATAPAKAVTLGGATTNGAGIAELKGASLEDLRKAGRVFTFKAAFAGNEKFLTGETTLGLTDVTISLSAETVDSVNTVQVSVTSWNEKGEVVPIKEEEIKLYVPRMFSLLPIGDITTDEDGYGDFKFPSDLPGGVNGELTVVARIEEHATFGNAESSSPTTWGVKTQEQASRLPRALWSPNAPLWMLITFIILMTGVWYHYALIIYELIRISRSHHPDKIDYDE